MTYFCCNKCSGTFDPAFTYCPVCEDVPLVEQLTARVRELEEDAETYAKKDQANYELRQQLAKAEQLWKIAQGRCDGLEEKLANAEQRVADACANYVNRFINGDGILNEVWISDIESALRNGEWRKFVKEV